MAMNAVIIRKIRRFNMKIKDSIKRLESLSPSVIAFAEDLELNESIDIAIKALEELGKKKDLLLSVTLVVMR